MAFGNGAPRGWPGGIRVSDLQAYQPQRINAGAWWPDPANSIPVLLYRPYGSGPGSTYTIYPMITFPEVAVGGAQYWYVETSPPITWTSTQVKFRVHFVVEDSVTLPGNYRFTLGVKRNQDATAPSGAKVTGNSDYALTTTSVPQKKISAISSAITIPNATASDGLELELTRGTAPSNDESDNAYIIGIDLFFV